MPPEFRYRLAAEKADPVPRTWIKEYGRLESVRERFPHDGPSRLLAARCERMASEPPGDRWDGVFRMEHK